MFRRSLLVLLILFTFVSMLTPVQPTYAASSDIINTLAASTISNGGAAGGGILSTIFSLLFDKILGPILNIFKGSESTASVPIAGPTPAKPSSPVMDSGVLQGKIIVIDPGHGGSNPGAVGNQTFEKDNNLAVALLLRDKLTSNGAKVLMTRNTDRTVATEGSSLGQELQARVDLAETSHADIFISIHSNQNDDQNIKGTMTFYNTDKSSQLALEVQNAVVSQVKSVDKGTSPATFYVLRNTSMPSILVEMGFISNPQEAKNLSSNTYRDSIAQGIYNGVIKYFANH